MQRATVFLCAILLSSTAAMPLWSAQTPPDFQPDPKSVERYGPAYRYPQAGWIVLHIEGEPYERGYQHGKLLAPEIAAHIRCFAATQCSKSPSDGWKQTRTLVNALFMRRYHEEFLEEMKGIADGAAAGGAKFDNRPVDLVDVVALNSWPEVDTLDSALEATAIGLEGKRFPKAQPKKMPAPKPMHCSAFAATGPATADGKIVFGHITMFGLYPGSFYNVWLDVKPVKGHRVIMQSYPAGIQSGLDYYMNDVGILVCETTLAQTKFDIKGLTVASRIRQALQYADNIDTACEILAKENNGLYTNEWLLGDTKTNEIAMFELGTHKSHLYRSSKKEWFGGTEGFYWGCNNTKDLEVRLETVASLDGAPANVVFHPSDRDKMWLQLYGKWKGKMNADFGKEAFTTPPLAAYHSLDAKFTTSDMAKDLQSWAVFGPPLGKTWQPTDDEKRRFPEVKPLVGNPWTVIHVQPPAADKNNGKAAAVDLKSHGEHDAHKGDGKETEENLLASSEDDTPPSTTAWHGTLFPKTDADIWLATAFADYHRYVVAEKNVRLANDGKLKDEDKENLAVYRNKFRSRYLAAAKVAGDKPLSEIKPEMEKDEWYRIATGKGFLAFHELRQLLGDPLFEDTMDAFGKDNGGKQVTSADFRAFVEKKTDKKLDKFFDTWMKEKGLPVKSAKEEPSLGSGLYTLSAFHNELDKTLIVYGTGDEINTNREGGEALQKAIRQAHSNYTVKIKSDKEVVEGDCKSHHLLLIGRPDTNALVEKFQKSLPIQFGFRSFVLGKDSYAHAGTSVTVASNNPENDRFSLVVIAGLNCASTLEAAATFMNRGEGEGAEVIVMPKNGKMKALVMPAGSANVTSSAKK